MDTERLAFTKALVQFRLAHPVFRRRRFLQGVEARELQWFSTQGAPMTPEDWANEETKCLAIFLDGRDDPDTDADGRSLVDDDFLILVNSWVEPVEFVLPKVGSGSSWLTEIDTGRPPANVAAESTPSAAGSPILIGDFSLLVLRAV
jgi:isoamylase